MSPSTLPPSDPSDLAPSTPSAPALPALIWFTDLGSGSLDLLAGLDCIIADHHVPAGSADIPTVNPQLLGLSGALELSGAGAAFLVAKELDPANGDLAALAVVGAVGDLQDQRDCRLTGLNRTVLEEGRRAGVLDTTLDVRYFGRETRPVHKMLQYSSDPKLPGITGSEQSALYLLQELGIPLKDGEAWRCWTHLSAEEKRTVASALALRLLSHGAGHRAARRLVGEVYTLTREREGTELRDAKEFSTLLNSCGRHDRARLGLEVCKGDRGEALKRALGLLQGHRRTLVEGIQLVKELGLKRTASLQHFHAGDQLEDTVVGIVAGMLLGSGEAGADPNLPIFGFARAGEGGGVKVSARADRSLVEKGLDLSKVMREAAAAVGGTGGGHDVAAGGLIPEGAEARFLEGAERLVSLQLSPGRPPS